MIALDDFTLHGKTITVPDFSGYHTSELENYVADKELTYVVMDSIYDLEAEKGVVIDQMPKAGQQVKKGRKVYITINANSPKRISFPDLRDVTLRQASAILETYGIKIDSLKYKPDQCVNCVLGALKDTVPITPGELIPVSEPIILVLGGGLSDEYIEVPVLISLTLDEASSGLAKLGLNLGAVNYEDCENAEDTAKAKIFRQIPAHNEEEKIPLGRTVTLFLTADSTKIPVLEPDSTSNIN
jgi:beta-lactam-binding protein with PASTA domain